jgi:hypothetical protein
VAPEPPQHAAAAPSPAPLAVEPDPHPLAGELVPLSHLGEGLPAEPPLYEGGIHRGEEGPPVGQLGQQLGQDFI